MSNFGSIIHDVLRYKYKGCQYLTGETYESLQWLDTNTAKPTEAQLLLDIADYTANASKYNYTRLRATDYPCIGDQLDMLWHSMNSGEIPKSVAFFNACAAVKAQYPKT